MYQFWLFTSYKTLYKETSPKLPLSAQMTEGLLVPWRCHFKQNDSVCFGGMGVAGSKPPSRPLAGPQPSIFVCGQFLVVLTSSLIYNRQPAFSWWKKRNEHVLAGSLPIGRPMHFSPFIMNTAIRNNSWTALGLSAC
jgi:hypothetical protein